MEIIERYEFKYLLPSRLISAVREAAEATSHIDRYADAEGTYLIRSLYFDTPSLELYQANQREQPDRFKLRARMYPGKKSPVFLEVKRRVLDVIIKTRAAVPADRWREILVCEEAALATLSPSAHASVQPFLARYHRHHLEPTMLVDYEREAYVSDIDSYARLTFDRKIMVQLRDTLDFEADPSRFRAVDHVAQTNTPEPVTVLELKFERRPPRWMVELVKRLELVRHSFSKYCYGIAVERALPEQRIAARVA